MEQIYYISQGDGIELWGEIAMHYISNLSSQSFVMWVRFDRICVDRLSGIFRAHSEIPDPIPQSQNPPPEIPRPFKEPYSRTPKPPTKDPQSLL